MALFFLFNTVIVLTVVGALYVVWRGLFRPSITYLVDKGILQPVVERANTNHEPSASRRWWHFIAIGFLSVMLDFAVVAITHLKTPGERVVSWFCANGQCKDYDLWVIGMFPVVTDASLIFFVLWCAYSVWMDVRD